MNPNPISTKLWSVILGAMAITFLLLSGLTFFLWQQLSSEETTMLIRIIHQNMGYIFGGVIFFIAGLVFLLDGFIHIYILPLRKLIEETALINTVNPSHRIEPMGNEDIVRLGQLVNEGADRFESLKKNVEQEITLAKSETEQEKNILAAFMAELPEGVLICNSEGRILLYNKRARKLFSGDTAYEISVEDKSELPSGCFPIEASRKFIGIGRSVFSIIDKNLIVHALDEIAEKLSLKEKSVTSYFVIVTKENKLLRTEAVPVLNRFQKLTGFVLFFYDITNEIQKNRRIDLRLQSLIKQIRASLGGIQSAIETILAYPEMKTVQLERFKRIIHTESITLGTIVEKAAIDSPGHVHTQWPLIPMPVKDMIDTIKRKAEDKLDISIHIKDSSEKNWIRVDTYSFIFAILFVLNQLKDITGSNVYACTYKKKDRFIHLDLLWEGVPIMIDALRKWYDQVLMIGKEGVPLTLKEVIGHHEAGIWSSSNIIKNKSYIRFFLPAVKDPEADKIRTITILVEESRPVFYDFDLFDQPGQNPELDDRLLTDLEYTVFDTETTGLDPKKDQIISIGAVRIVNTRLLHEDFFDQLVNPQCALPPESTRIHGIRPEMLDGQPTIDRVLPLFQHFTEDTILVAHNAAFDMRMLRVKEALTGTKFINPVLDTLLLSDVLHPMHKNHNLEMIAKRMGISIVGRHTALGDAIATGEMFLKMIPLLAKQGIHTLKDARLISQKSYYSRLKY